MNEAGHSGRQPQSVLGIDSVGVCVVFICHDGSGRIAMAKRGLATRDEQGRWDVGGGAIELGKSAVETVHTEVMEEYGAPCGDIRFLGYRDVFRNGGGMKSHWLALDFLVHVEHGAVRNAEPAKLDDVAWFELPSLPDPLHSNIPHILQLYERDLSAVGISDRKRS